MFLLYCAMIINGWDSVKGRILYPPRGLRSAVPQFVSSHSFSIARRDNEPSSFLVKSYLLKTFPASISVLQTLLGRYGHFFCDSSILKNTEKGAFLWVFRNVSNSIACVIWNLDFVKKVLMANTKHIKNTQRCEMNWSGIISKEIGKYIM